MSMYELNDAIKYLETEFVAKGKIPTVEQLADLVSKTKAKFC